MKIRVGIGIIIFLQILILILLEVPETIWANWNRIHKQSRKISQNIEINPAIIDAHVDILSLPNKIESWNLLEEKWKWFFTDHKVKQLLFYNSHEVSFVGLSPSHKKLGFFFYPENNSLGEIVLAILDIDQKIIKEVYRGNTWTSNWEWKGDEAIIVKHSCGTGCMNASVINISTGKNIEQYRVY
ncbi:MAG: hypothetical protein Q7R97_03605 [Candidatus Daviesbacteria bacterium]|nr:hypothetical protein [Candidatus Daviesbacteria bacterium]